MVLQDTMLPTGGAFADSRFHPVYVQKGDTVTTSFYALHRRQDLCGDTAILFRPEGWENLRLPPWCYLTFGSGPRVCPGQNPALTEVAYTIVKILHVSKTIENGDPVVEFWRSIGLPPKVEMVQKFRWSHLKSDTRTTVSRWWHVLLARWIFKALDFSYY